MTPSSARARPSAAWRSSRRSAAVQARGALDQVTRWPRSGAPASCTVTAPRAPIARGPAAVVVERGVGGGGAPVVGGLGAQLRPGRDRGRAAARLLEPRRVGAQGASQPLRGHRTEALAAHRTVGAGRLQTATERVLPGRRRGVSHGSARRRWAGPARSRSPARRVRHLVEAVEPGAGRRPLQGGRRRGQASAPTWAAAERRAWHALRSSSSPPSDAAWCTAATRAPRPATRSPSTSRASGAPTARRGRRRRAGARRRVARRGRRAHGRRSSRRGRRGAEFDEFLSPHVLLRAGSLPIMGPWTTSRPDSPSQPAPRSGWPLRWCCCSRSARPAPRGPTPRAPRPAPRPWPR